MNRARPLIVLVLVLASLLVVSTPPPARATAQPPFSTIQIGDWWTYNLADLTAGTSVNATDTIVGATTIPVDRVATNCYNVSITSTGTFNHLAVSGTLNESGTALFRRSDMAQVSNNVTNIFTAIHGGSFVLTEIVYTNTSIPVAPYQFPLDFGQSWSDSYNQTTVTTSYTNIDPVPTVKTNTTRISVNFNVTGESTVSVPAGTFDAYDIHSTDTTGSTDDYYSPQVDNSIQAVSHLANGTLAETISLENFSAWAFQSSITVSKSGTNYNVGIYADATISSRSQNSTAITFQVNATSGTSGRANVAIPKTLNNTLVKIYLDNSLETPTVTTNATSYIFYFTFGLTTHTVTLVYATLPALSLTTYLLYGGIAAAVAIVIITALLLMRRRARPAPSRPAPTTAI